jgi:hypothetical protein
VCKNPSLFTDVVEYFKKNKNLININVSLIGIESYEPSIRIKLEIFFTMLNFVVKNVNTRISMDRVRSIEKNKELVNEYVKYYRELKK